MLQSSTTPVLSVRGEEGGTGWIDTEREKRFEGPREQKLQDYFVDQQTCGYMGITIDTVPYFGQHDAKRTSSEFATLKPRHRQNGTNVSKLTEHSRGRNNRQIFEDFQTCMQQNFIFHCCHDNSCS